LTKTLFSFFSLFYRQFYTLLLLLLMQTLAVAFSKIAKFYTNEQTPFNYQIFSNETRQNTDPLYCAKHCIIYLVAARIVSHFIR